MRCSGCILMTVLTVVQIVDRNALDFRSSSNVVPKGRFVKLVSRQPVKVHMKPMKKITRYIMPPAPFREHIVDYRVPSHVVEADSRKSISERPH